MSDADDDALLESLERETETDPSLAYLREARIQQLSSEISRARALRNEGCGVYTEIKDEKQMLDITTSHPKCIVHFFKSDFNRCRIMDGHLNTLAEQHLEARICRIDVENAPFLVTRLSVKVLPCVIAFKDGISVDKVIGFEGLGSRGDSFETSQLEKRLAKVGVLDESFVNLAQHQRGVGQSPEASVAAAHREDADDDDDWD